jgi:hypothetical protein
MLTSPNYQIQYFHQRATECARKALNAATDEARNELLALEQHWLALARGYAADERDLKRRLNRGQSLDAGSPNTGGPRETIVFSLIGETFTPEAVEELSQAFDRVCSALMVLPSDPKAEQIIRKIIELKQRGLRDSTQLFCTAILELNSRE